ncbi:MAG: flippase-like domain-containing protein [Candidatus Zixiibacteriota bacterium]|nr:MAG: flippase-like domain-containing protein [candidate division Zixibacteria bacterium]
MFLKKKQFWGTLVAIALLVYCVKDIRLHHLEALSERLDWVYLVPAVASAFVFMIARALRWRLMVSRNRSVPAGRVITLYSAGQILNIIMPALTGQVGRLILFARSEGLRKTFVFSTILLEVLFDAISLIIVLILTSLAFVLPAKYGPAGYIISALVAVVLILLYLILHYQHRLEDIGRKHLRDRWPGIYVSLRKSIRSFTQGLNLLRSSQHFIGGLFYSLLSWITHILVVYFLLRSFGFHLPIAAAASVMIINTLALMIPITPGNAGTFEFAVSTALAAFPEVGRSDAVLFALALHILDILPMMLLGFIYLKFARVSISELKEKHEDEDIFDRVSDDGTLIEDEETV